MGCTNSKNWKRREACGRRGARAEIVTEGQSQRTKSGQKELRQNFEKSNNNTCQALIGFGLLSLSGDVAGKPHASCHYHCVCILVHTATTSYELVQSKERERKQNELRRVISRVHRDGVRRARARSGEGHTAQRLLSSGCSVPKTNIL
jgi:hypothetical protein